MGTRRVGSGSGSRTGTFELPLDIQEQAVGRLGAFSLAFAASFLTLEIAPGETAVGRADLYSLGCVAYWLITGAEVFPEDTAMKVIMAHVNAAAEPPSVRGGRRVPASLESIVMQCLEKRPDERPASALEIHRRLETCDIDPAWTEEDAIGWWTEQRLV